MYRIPVSFDEYVDDASAKKWCRACIAENAGIVALRENNRLVQQGVVDGFIQKSNVRGTSSCCIKQLHVYRVSCTEFDALWYHVPCFSQ